MELSSSPLAALLHSPLFFLLAAALVLVPVFSLLTFSRAKKPPPSYGDGGGRRMLFPLPPSPPGAVPFLGHLPILGSLPHRKLRSLAAAHGAVMLLRFGGAPTVVASSSAAAREAMRTRDLAFASRAPVRMAERLLYGRDMVFAPYGEFWRQARRVAVLHLLSPRRISSFRRVREREVAALLDRVRRHRDADAGVINVSNLLMSYANGVISRAAFGDGGGGHGLDGERLRKLFADFEGLLGTMTVGEFVPWLAWVDKLMGLDAKAARTSAALDGLLERVIAEHRERRRRRRGETVGGDGEGDGDHRDFVDVMLDVSEAEEDAGAGAGEVQFDTVAIKAIILDMIAAATDTTFTTLEWAMAELINHPSTMRILQHDIRAAVGAVSGNQVTEDNIGELLFLRAVVKETLRLHAPVPLLVPRETTEDTQLLGYRVPARTRVVINAWAIGRDAAAWGETAEEFSPERWLDGAGGGEAVEYAAQIGQDFRFVPFGAGRRGCPGAGFAAPSVELALAGLLYHFDWDLPPAAAGGTAVARVDMSELYGLSVRLKAELNLVAKPWSSSV